MPGGAEAAVFFYAGHGVQDAGDNYLLPVSAKIQERNDLHDETLPLSIVMVELEQAAAGVSVVILDACRDNPLTSPLGETATRPLFARDGLATVRGATGTLIAYATAPGKVAYDGDANSPFSAALAEWIDEPGLDIGLMFRRVRQNVVEATGGSQVPWVEESILGDFYFAEGHRETAPQVAPAARPFDIADPDAVFWRTIIEMQTKDEKRAGLNLYLSVFPTGEFADEAGVQLAALDVGQQSGWPSATLSDVSAPGAGAFTDLLFWERVSQSVNPADFEEYLKTYPNGLFTGVAAERLATLEENMTAESDLYALSFNIPFDSRTYPLTFQQAEIDRAMKSVATARVDRLPDVGDLLIGTESALVGDEISQSDLSQVFYIPMPGVTGPLGKFAVSVTVPDGSEGMLSADINVRYPEQPVREIAATAGIGPVPITIALPAMPSGEQSDLVIDALPHQARIVTASSEIGVPGNIPVYNGVAELAIALPDSAVGNVGQIVYSYQPSALGLRDDIQTKDGLLQEAITVTGIKPSYSAQTKFDAYVGVGPQPLPIVLPEDVTTKVLIEEVPFGNLLRDDGSQLVIADYLPVSALADLTFEAHRHITGPVGHLAYSYEVPSGDRLIQAVAINAAIHDCDLLAADPFDPDRVSDGKWLWRVRGQGRKAETFLDSAAAILACLSASEAFPDVVRFKLQVGRAYTAAKDWENALEWLTPLAERGNITAMSAVAWHYSNGWGVPVDHKRAYNMWVIAANQGSVPGAHELGKAYKDGRGVERDYAKAFKWIKVAADWGFEWAQLNLGKLYRAGLGVQRDYVRAAELFEKVYDHKNAFGNLELGRLYLAGRGVPKDVKRAEQLFSEISDLRGLPAVEWALYELARMYRSGKGVRHNIPKAMDLFKQAAEGGVASAKVEMAQILLTGEGVAPDPARAVELLESAGAEGVTRALFVLGRALETGEILAQDRARAIALYQEAAEAGNAGAQIRLGDLLRAGDGLPRDPAKARRMFDQASRRGNLWGTLRLAEMKSKGEGGPVDLDNAIAHYGEVLQTATKESQQRTAKRALEALPKQALVRAVQIWLRQQGLDPGVPDGVNGPRTQSAIKAFQRSRGLTPTGRVSADLIAALAP